MLIQVLTLVILRLHIILDIYTYLLFQYIYQLLEVSKRSYQKLYKSYIIRLFFAEISNIQL
jgi:hypothetical protein